MAQKCWKKINLWQNWFFKSIVLFRWFLSSGSTRKDHKTIQDKILSRFYLKESIVSKNERKFKRRSKQFGNGLKKGQLESIWWQNSEKFQNTQFEYTHWIHLFLPTVVDCRKMKFKHFNRLTCEYILHACCFLFTHSEIITYFYWPNGILYERLTFDSNGLLHSVRLLMTIQANDMQRSFNLLLTLSFRKQPSQVSNTVICNVCTHKMSSLLRITDHDTMMKRE